jgi:glucokinase
LLLVDALGIDIGGTKIAAALVSPDGEVGTVLARPTTADDPDRIIASVAELVEELSGPNVLETVGVAAAAFLDRGRDTVYLAPNISWKNFPLRARLVDALGRPVSLENDANAAGWAEFQFGAARSAESMIMLTIGTGVGGAIVESGKLLLGGFGAGAELGHLIIDPGGRLCGCGTRGCLEQYASGTALVREARELLGREDVGSAELMELFENGDERARDALEKVGTALGVGISSLVAMIDPEVIVIGGGVAAAGEHLLDPVRRSFQATYGPYRSRPTPDILVATLGNTAGVVGAADLARQAPGGAL